MRKINNEGLNLIKAFEGCKLEAYRCPAGIPTIGYGSTGEHVKMGMRITQQEADALLLDDLKRFEAGVEKIAKVSLSDNEFSALVSFAFNLGLKALENSTLLRLLNAGKRAEAAAEFPKWNKAGGKVLKGLVRRRAAEQALFTKQSG